jgi:hypothetical protein
VRAWYCVPSARPAAEANQALRKWHDKGYADKVAGSAWVGREFCERTYGGEGPFWHEYWHMFADKEIGEVAELLGVFWQRPDLEHYHNHWMRQGKPVPEFLKEASGPSHWGRYSTLFNQRKQAGFPGH